MTKHPFVIFAWTYMILMIAVLTIGGFSACSEADTQNSSKKAEEDSKVVSTPSKDAGVAKVSEKPVIKNDMPTKDPKDEK